MLLLCDTVGGRWTVAAPLWPLSPARAAAQIEGRGNGIKTNVVNNVEVAKALERPADCAGLFLNNFSVPFCVPSALQCWPAMPLRPDLSRCCVIDIVKFYGCELGAQTKFDKKTGTSIVNGAHDTGKLVELLEVPAFVVLFPWSL